MTIEGIDSYAHPGGAAIAAAGKHFSCRYLTGLGKAMTIAELDDLFAHGIAVVANFESSPDRALAGWGAGVEDALDARKAMNALGFPDRCPVYFSVDFNAQITQQRYVDQYLKGAATVLGANRIGVYGSYATVTRCKANKTAAYFWQTLAWSSGHIAGWSHIVQWMNDQKLNGHLVDYDRAMTDDYGQWLPDTAGPEEPATDMIYTRGGLQTVAIGPGVEYSHEPGGAPVATVTPGRYFVRAFDVSGHNVAIDGLYSHATATTTTACGWVSTTQVSDPLDVNTTDCTDAVEAAITADRAKARIVYE